MPREIPKLKIFASIPANWNASFYYRCVLPITQMEEQGFDVIYVIDDHKTTMDHPALTDDERTEAFALADVSFGYQVTSAAYSYNISVLRSKPPKYFTPQWLWRPPVFIMDTDDDVFNCLPLNPAFKSLGWKGPDGTPLADGSVVSIQNPKDGKEIVLWKDGEGGFDIARNRKRVMGYRDLLSQCNLITCSTKRCEEYVLREAPNARTFVTPNAIDFKEYPNIELADHPNEVRILWQGSTTHHEDLWPLRDAMKRITQKYPEVTWVFWGAPYQWLYKHLPAERVSVVKWVEYEAYKTRLSTINHDINIAPLQPYLFNQSRSAIKFTESSAICKPAATLAQRTGEYQDVIIEGETGMLFSNPKEFEEKLGIMVEDRLLRAKMAANAKDWVRTFRDVRVVVPKLYEKYLETREQWVKSLPEPLPYKEPDAKPSKQQRGARKRADVRRSRSTSRASGGTGVRPYSPASC